MLPLWCAQSGPLAHQPFLVALCLGFLLAFIRFGATKFLGTQHMLYLSSLVRSACSLWMIVSPRLFCIVMAYPALDRFILVTDDVRHQVISWRFP